MPSQRGLPAAQGRSLRRQGPRGFTSRCSPSRRRFRRLDTASAPRPLTNGHLLGHSQTDAAPPLSRSALRSELRPPGRAAIRVISTSSLHLKRGTLAISSSQPMDSQYRRTLSRVCCIAWFGDACTSSQQECSREFPHLLPIGMFLKSLICPKGFIECFTAETATRTNAVNLSCNSDNCYAT